jgi:hypothetical protein
VLRLVLAMVIAASLAAGNIVMRTSPEPSPWLAMRLGVAAIGYGHINGNDGTEYITK